MKKAIAIAFLIMATITGCSKVNISASLEDFYLKSMIEQSEDISLKDAKESLQNFEYEYKLEEYSKQFSKEEIDAYEKEFGQKFEMSDMSFSTFSDKNSNIELVFDETNKKMTGATYTIDEDNIKKTINKMNDICSIHISGDNIKYVEAIINRLNLSQNASEVAGLYFGFADTMKNNKNITIKDIQEILDTEYEKRNEEIYGENYYIYTFKTGDGDVYIDVDEEDGKIVKIGMDIGISDYANYLVNLSIANENIFTGEKGFNLDMNMHSNLNYKMFDKPQDEIKEAYKPVNKEMFEFAYKDGVLKFYTDEYDENKTDIIECRYNEKEEAYVMIPNESRIVTESLYSEEEKFVTIKLNKDEKLDVEINTEKEIGKPLSITLLDLSSGKVIFEEEIDAKSKNIISTKKVDKDGEYKLVLECGKMDNYYVKVWSVKTSE